MKKKEQAVCICCNKPLRKRQRKFCSKACKNNWWNNHLNQLKGEMRKCPICGKPFYYTPSKDQKFCSHECYIKHRYPEGDKKPVAETPKKVIITTPVNDKRFQPQIDHDLSLEIGDRLLEAKLVLVSELSKYQELIYRQYSPFITTLLRTDLKSANTNANMVVHERRNKR